MSLRDCVGMERVSRDEREGGGFAELDELFEQRVAARKSKNVVIIGRHGKIKGDGDV